MRPLCVYGEQRAWWWYCRACSRDIFLPFSTIGEAIDDGHRHLREAHA